MTLALPGRVVVFDYGEVISVSPTAADRAVLEGIAGVPSERFWAAYNATRDELDRGTLASGDYWRGIGEACGRQWDDGTVQRLWSADIRGWTSANPEVVAIIAELAAAGTRLALLSNAAEEYGSLFRFSPMARCFERVFVSGELRMLKPDAEIYEHVAAELGVTPAELVFVDNRAVNVEGAEAIGITGHVFTGAADLRAFLESQGESEVAA